jgi:hypothetical protein
LAFPGRYRTRNRDIDPDSPDDAGGPDDLGHPARGV